MCGDMLRVQGYTKRYKVFGLVLSSGEGDKKGN